MSPRRIAFGDVTVLVLPSAAARTALPGEAVTETASSRLPGLATVIREIAKDFGAELRTIAEELSPNEVELELKFGLSEGCDFWFINVEGEQAITVKMVWKSDGKE